MIFKRQSRHARLARLFELYEQGMYRIAYAILHDEGQAEDAVMAAFERIVRREGLPPRPESDDARRLCGAIVKSCAIDIYRKNARVREREALADPLTANEGANWTAEPAAFAEADGDPSVADMAARLPDPYRAVVVERFGENRSVRETAEKLGITEENVRVRQHRALAMLRAQKEELL